MGAVADGGVEPEELEHAVAVLAASFSSLVAAPGQVPRELHEALVRRAGASVVVVARGRFGEEDALQGGHGVAELPVHRLGRSLPIPSLLPLWKMQSGASANEKSVSMCKFTTTNFLQPAEEANVLLYAEELRVCRDV